MLLGAACALVPALAMWGFTVDDALIPVRYAHNLASGAGYRFDAHGASTDGVTPLPWALLLAPLSSPDGLVVLVRAKVLGVAAWTVGGAALGARVGAMVRGRPLAAGRDGRPGAAGDGPRVPDRAWAASGMETGLATALATVAVARLGVSRPSAVAATAGVVASLRPEMVVWAIALAVGAAVLGRESDREGARRARRRLGPLRSPRRPSSCAPRSGLPSSAGLRRSRCSRSRAISLTARSTWARRRSCCSRRSS